MSDECLRFTPAIRGSADLGLVPTPSSIPGLQDCWLQKEPATHRLPGLDGIPILISTGEASYHAQYDHCTSVFLNQAGVPNTWLNLATVGIKGNGHMQMIESNNLAIARYYEQWLLSKLQ